MKVIFQIEVETREEYSAETLREVLVGLEDRAHKYLSDTGGNVGDVKGRVTTELTRS